MNDQSSPATCDPRWLRRHFLSLALPFAAVPLATRASSEEQDGPTGKQVIVIGAGLAGLAAAQTLKQRGYQVLVLESRDRLGGRTWTSHHWKDAPLDLGASWIHGLNGNPITELAEAAGASTVATFYDQSILYDTSGQPLTDQQHRQFETLQRRVHRALQSAQQQDLDQSVRQAIAPLRESSQQSAGALKMIDFIVNSEIEQEYSGGADQLSAHWFDDAREFEGDDALIREGFEAITTHLARGLSIKLEQIVTRIDWNQSRVKVHTDRQQFDADHVIVTVPLGVLKAKRIEFSPPLPRSKQLAIDRLGFGVLNKCYLRFEKVFWPEPLDWIEYLPAQAGMWAEWVSLQRSLHFPVLLGFNAAHQGAAMEAWTDPQIVASAMSTLKTIFGDQIPQPSDYQVTRWAADKHSYGSYSFHAVGSTPKMRDDLAAPLGDRVYFAGEATERHYYATTHGAYLSGLRAAKQLSAVGRR